MVDIHKDAGVHMRQTAQGYLFNVHCGTGAPQLQQAMANSKEAQVDCNDESGRKHKGHSFPSAARNSTNSDFSIPAFQTQPSQQEAHHRGDQNAPYTAQQILEASIERVDGCRQDAREHFSTSQHGRIACNLDGQMNPRPMNAAIITPERERLQYLSPFNNDERVRFAQDWTYQRPVGRPSDCSSHVQTSDSSSVPENFHAVCQGHMQHASSSNELVAEYESDGNLGSLLSYHSVVGELEELQRPRASAIESGAPEQSAISSRDYSESHDYDSNTDSASGSWQEQSERRNVEADSHAQCHPPHPPEQIQQAQQQHRWSHAEHAFHLAQSLQASAVYVQQLQEMQHRMQQHIHNDQLQISALRYALAEAHCKIASQGSEIASLQAMLQLASKQPFPNASPANDSSLGGTSATLDSSNPVESINSCVGAPAPGKVPPAQPEDPQCEPVWNPVFSIEGASQCQYDSSASSSSASVPTSTGGSNSSNGSDPCSDDTMLSHELSDTSDSSDSSADSATHSAKCLIATLTPESKQGKTSDDDSCSEGDIMPSAELSCSSSTVNRAKQALKAAEATAANHELHVLDLLGDQPLEGHGLSDSCESSKAAISGKDGHYSVDLCTNEAASWRDRAQSSVKFQHHPRLLAAIELLHETVRDAQKLYAPHLCGQQPHAQPELESSDKDHATIFSSDVVLHGDTTGDLDCPNEDARLPNIAACAWTAVQKTCWLAGGIAGLASLASDTVESISACTAVSARQKMVCAPKAEHDAAEDTLDREADLHDQPGIAAEWQVLDLNDEAEDASDAQEDAFDCKELVECAVPALPVPCALFMMGAEDAAGIEDYDSDFENENHDALHPGWDSSSVEIIEIADSLPVCFDSLPVHPAEPHSAENGCVVASAVFQETATDQSTDEAVSELQMTRSTAASCNDEVVASAPSDAAKSESINATWSSMEEYFQDLEDTESDVDNEYLFSRDNLLLPPATKRLSAFSWSYCRDCWEDHRLQPELELALQHMTTEAALVLDAPVPLQISPVALQPEISCHLLDSPANCTEHIAPSLSGIASSSSIEDEIASEDTSLLLTGAEPLSMAPLLEAGSSVEDVFSAQNIVSSASMVGVSTGAHGNSSDSVCNNSEAVIVYSEEGKLHSAGSEADPFSAQAGLSDIGGISRYMCPPEDEKHPSTLHGEAEHVTEQYTVLPSADCITLGSNVKLYNAQDEFQLTREPSVAEWGAFQEAHVVATASDSVQTAEIPADAHDNSLVHDHFRECRGAHVTLVPVGFQEMAQDEFSVASDSCEHAPGCEKDTCSSASTANDEEAWYSRTDQAENDTALGDALCTQGPVMQLVPEAARDVDVVFNASAHDSFNTELEASDCEWLCSPAGLNARHLFAGRFSTHGGVFSSENDETQYKENCESTVHQFSISDWFDHAEPDPADVGKDWEGSWLGATATTNCNSPDNKLAASSTSEDAVMHALVAAGMLSPEKAMCTLVTAGMEVPEPFTGHSSPASTVQTLPDVCALPTSNTVAVSLQSKSPAGQDLSDHAADVPDAPAVCSFTAASPNAVAPFSASILDPGTNEVCRDVAVSGMAGDSPDSGNMQSGTPRPQIPLFTSAYHPSHAHLRKQATSAKPASRQVGVSCNRLIPASRSYVPGSRATLAGVAKADIVGFLVHGGQYSKEMAASCRHAYGIPWKSNSFSSAAVPQMPQGAKAARPHASKGASVAKQRDHQPDLGQAQSSAIKAASVTGPKGSECATQDRSNSAEVQNATTSHRECTPQPPAACYSETSLQQQENNSQHIPVPSIQPPYNAGSLSRPVEPIHGPEVSQPQAMYPEPLSARSLVQVEDFSPRSFAPPEEPILPPASSSKPVSVCNTKVGSGHTQVCHRTVALSAADAQRSWTAAQNSINNVNKRSRAARSAASVATLGAKQPVIGVDEAIPASREGSTVKAASALGCIKLSGDVNSNQTDVLVDGPSAAHRALLRSLKRHRQVQETASGPAQRPCRQKSDDAQSARQLQTLTPHGSGGQVLSSPAAAYSGYKLQNSKYTGSLSNSEIQSNLAIARRAFKRMQEKQA